MLDESCVFCKIVGKSIPSDVIYEDDYVLVIKDLNPRASVHYLLIPRIHLTDMNSVNDSNIKFVFKMVESLSKVSAYIKKKYAMNTLPELKHDCKNDKSAGQEVMHLHWHYLSNSI